MSPLRKVLDIIVAVGSLCALIIFITIVARVMVDVVGSVWSGKLW